MSLEEYWDKSPELIIYYRDAFNLKRQRKSEELWLEGIYIMSAIGSCFAKNNKYPKEPIRITEKTKAEKELEVKQATEKVVAWLSTWRTVDE